MSTPAEDKLVAYLRKLQALPASNSSSLSYIQKIYDDPPRQDSTKGSFPRLKVTEISSPSEKAGIGEHSYKYYSVLLEVACFVAIENGMQEVDGVEYAPEKAANIIAWDVRKKIEDNEVDIANDNSHDFVLQNSDFRYGGLDNEYFEAVDVYKAFAEFNFDMRY